ncbi:HlyD family type I secretion periplasmic adaptor subunit [Tardiphaga sp. 1201_B9_N1_1]|uniref:HlyD family type I secretion periplasmic adaptor subunit n=1 Tax=Tardiphaga TaxID=1395974 RepID=UPI0028573D89|nr:HlyD family type I secretion periplasmic adaptor subunit [Tardiphaga robiniae]MDR6662080.1 epimerase transport system membrane fusion protein [Tardiphaga robiniae]
MTTHVHELLLGATSSHEILEKPRSDARRLIKWGAFLLAIQFGGFGLWATFVPLRSAVIAPGIIKVQSKRKAVQHFDGGILKTIYVRENEQVEAGQIVAKLDTTQVEGSLGVLETKLFADLSLDARLLAEQMQSTAISFPDELRNSPRPEAKTAIQTQETEFATRSSALTGERQLIDQQTRQLMETAHGLENSRTSLQEQLQFLQEEIRDTASLLEKGLARKPRVLALKRAEADMQAQLTRNLTQQAETRGKIAELVDRGKQLGLNQSQDIAKQSHATRESIGDLRHRIGALREQLARTDLRAPESGRVVRLNSRELNTVLAPRETLMEIVPIEDRLVIEASLRPQDREEVMAGQNARIRIIALNIRRRPMLEGQVTAVAADAFTDTKSGVTSYMAEIDLQRSPEVEPHLTTLKPGLPVEVFVETGIRTFAEYLIQPLRLRVHRAFRES